MAYRYLNSTQPSVSGPYVNMGVSCIHSITSQKYNFGTTIECDDDQYSDDDDLTNQISNLNSTSYNSPFRCMNNG